MTNPGCHTNRRQSGGVQNHLVAAIQPAPRRPWLSRRAGRWPRWSRPAGRVLPQWEAGAPGVQPPLRCHGRCGWWCHPNTHPGRLTNRRLSRCPLGWEGAAPLLCVSPSPSPGADPIPLKGELGCVRHQAGSGGPPFPHLGPTLSPSRKDPGVTGAGLDPQGPVEHTSTTLVPSSGGQQLSCCPLAGAGAAAPPVTDPGRSTNSRLLDHPPGWGGGCPSCL